MQIEGDNDKSRPPMGLTAHAQVLALDLGESCAAENEDDYVAKAAALAADPARLLELSTRLRARMQSSWLMDYVQYGKEAAVMYRQMWRDWCAKQAGDAT